MTYLVWPNGHHTAEAAGQYFQGTSVSLPSARTRGAAYLGKNRKLNAKRKDRVAV